MQQQDFIPSPLISVTDESQGEAISTGSTNPFRITESAAIRPYQFSPSDLKEFYANSLWFDGVKFSIPTVINIFSSANMGNTPDQARLFSLMMTRDLVLAAHMCTRINAVLGCEWDIMDDPDDPSSKSKAKVIKKMLEQAGMRGLMGHLLSAIPFGYAGANPIYDQKRGTVIEEFNLVHPAAFYFDVAGRWELRGLISSKATLFSRQHQTGFIFHRYQAQPGTPQIGGLLRNCAFSYLFKHEIKKHHIHFLEKFGIPQLIGKISNEDFNDSVRRNAILEALASLGANGVGVTNKETDIQPLNAPANGSNGDFEKASESINDEYAMLILGQKASMGTAGGMSNGQIQNAVRIDILKADSMSLIETIQNQVIAPLEKFKWGTSSCKFFMNFNPSENIKDLADVVAKLAPAGFKAERRWVEENLKIKLATEESAPAALPSVQSSLPALGGAGAVNPLSQQGQASLLPQLPELPQQDLGSLQPSSQTMAPLTDDPVKRKSRRKGSLKSISLVDGKDSFDVTPATPSPYQNGKDQEVVQPEQPVYDPIDSLKRRLYETLPQPIADVSTQAATPQEMINSARKLTAMQMEHPDITEEDRKSYGEIRDEVENIGSEFQQQTQAQEPVEARRPDFIKAASPNITEASLKNARETLAQSLNEAILASNAGNAKLRGDFGTDEYYGQWFDRSFARLEPEMQAYLKQNDVSWISDSRTKFISDAKMSKSLTEEQLLQRVPFGLTIPKSETYAMSHSFISNVGESIYRGYENMGLHIDTALNALTGDITGAGETLRKQQQYNNLQAVSDAIKTDSKIANTIYFISEMVPIVLSGTALATTGVGAMAIPGLFGLDTFGATYNDMRNTGVDNRIALAGSTGMGVLGAILGGAQLGSMVPVAMKTSMLAFKNATTESIGQALAARLKQVTSQYGVETVSNALSYVGRGVMGGYTFAITPTAAILGRKGLMSPITGTLDATTNGALQSLASLVSLDVARITNDNLYGTNLAKDNPSLSDNLSQVMAQWKDQLIPMLGMTLMGHYVFNPLATKAMQSKYERAAKVAEEKAPSAEATTKAAQILPEDMTSAEGSREGLIVPLAKLLDENRQLMSALDAGTLSIRLETMEKGSNAYVVRDDNGKSSIVINKIGLMDSIKGLTPDKQAVVIQSNLGSLFRHEGFVHWFLYGMEGTPEATRRMIEDAAINDPKAMSAESKAQYYDRYLQDAGISDPVQRRMASSRILEGKSIDDILAGRKLYGKPATTASLNAIMREEAGASFIADNIGKINPTTKLGQAIQNMVSWVERNMADVLENTARFIAPDAIGLSAAELRKQAALRLVGGALRNYRVGGMAAQAAYPEGKAPETYRTLLEQAGVTNKAQADAFVNMLETLPRDNDASHNQLNSELSQFKLNGKKLSAELLDSIIKSDVRYALKPSAKISKTPKQYASELSKSARSATEEKRAFINVIDEYISQSIPDEKVANRIRKDANAIQLSTKEGIEGYKEKITKFINDDLPEYSKDMEEKLKTQTEKAEDFQQSRAMKTVQAVLDLPFLPSPGNLLPDGMLAPILKKLEGIYGKIDSGAALYRLGWDKKPGTDYTDLKPAEQLEWDTAYATLVAEKDSASIPEYTKELRAAFEDNRVIEPIVTTLKSRLVDAKVNQYQRRLIIDNVNRLHDKGNYADVVAMVDAALDIASKKEANDSYVAASLNAETNFKRAKSMVSDAERTGKFAVDASGKEIIDEASQNLAKLRDAIRDVYASPAERTRGLNDAIPFMDGNLAIKVLNHEWVASDPKTVNDAFKAFVNSLDDSYVAANKIDKALAIEEFNNISRSSSDLTADITRILGPGILTYKMQHSDVVFAQSPNKANISSVVNAYQSKLARISSLDAELAGLLDRRRTLENPNDGSVSEQNQSAYDEVQARISAVDAELHGLTHPKVLSLMSTEQLMAFSNDVVLLREEGKSYSEFMQAFQKAQRDDAVVMGDKELSDALPDLEANISDMDRAAMNQKGQWGYISSAIKAIKLKETLIGNMQPQLIIEILTGFKANSTFWQNTMKAMNSAVFNERRMRNDMNTEIAKIAVELQVDGDSAKRAKFIEWADASGTMKKLTVPQAMEIKANSKNPQNRKHLIGTADIGNDRNIDAICHALETQQPKYSAFVDKVMEKFMPIVYGNMNMAFKRMHGITLRNDPGYWSIRNLLRDRFNMTIDEDMLRNGSNMRNPSVSVSGVKQRTDSSKGFNLDKMDFFSTLGYTIEDTVRYSTMAPAIKHISDFLNPLYLTLEKSHPNLKAALQRWIYDSAFPAKDFTQEQNLRQIAGFAALAAKPTSIIMQFGSYATGLMGMSRKGWMESMNTLLSIQPINFISDVAELSQFMKHRPSFDIERYGDATLDQVFASYTLKNDMISWMRAMVPVNFEGKVTSTDLWRTAKMTARMMMKPMSITDQFVAKVVWKFRYIDYMNRVKPDGTRYTQEEAVSLADESVIRSQSINDPRMIPEYMRRPGFYKVCAMFMGPVLQANNVTWAQALKVAGVWRQATEAQRNLSSQEGGRLGVMANLVVGLGVAGLINSLLTYSPKQGAEAENILYETANIGIGGIPVWGTLGMFGADIYRASWRKAHGLGGDVSQTARQGGINVPQLEIIQDNMSDAIMLFTGQIGLTEEGKRFANRNLSGLSWLWKVGDNSEKVAKTGDIGFYVYSSTRKEEKRYQPLSMALNEGLRGLDNALMNFNQAHPEDAWYAGKNSKVWKFGRYQINLTGDEYSEYNSLITSYFMTDPSMQGILGMDSLSLADVITIEKALGKARSKAKNDLRYAIVMNHENDIKIPGVKSGSYEDLIAIATTGKPETPSYKYEQVEAMHDTCFDVRLMANSLILADDTDVYVEAPADIKKQAILAVQLDRQMDTIKAQLDLIKTNIAPYVQKAPIVTGIGKTLSWNPESDRLTLNRDKITAAIISNFKVNNLMASKVINDGSNRTLTKGHVKIVDSANPIKNITSSTSSKPKIEKPVAEPKAKSYPEPVAPQAAPKAEEPQAKASVKPAKPVEPVMPEQVKQPVQPSVNTKEPEGLGASQISTSE